MRGAWHAQGREQIFHEGTCPFVDLSFGPSSFQFPQESSKQPLQLVMAGHRLFQKQTWDNCPKTLDIIIPRPLRVMARDSWSFKVTTGVPHVKLRRAFPLGGQLLPPDLVRVMETGNPASELPSRKERGKESLFFPGPSP